MATQPQPEAQMSGPQHAEHIANMLRQAAQESEADIQRVNDPKAQALFETVREVLLGTTKALEDYAHKREPVWQ